MNSKPTDYKLELFEKLFGEEAQELYHDFRSKSKYYLKSEGEVLFQEGTSSNFVFLILDGSVRLQVKKGNSEEVILQFFGEGDLAGIMDVIQYQVYRSNAIVHSATAELCVIDKQNFFKILSKRHHFALKLIQQMDKDTADIESRAAFMNTQKVTNRISGAIQVLEKKFGKNAEGEINIEISPSHIAKMVGATRTSVYRSMKKLQELGELRFEQHKIILP